MSHTRPEPSTSLSFILAMALPLTAIAQPAEWVVTPTNAAGTLLGTVTVGGQAAQAGDWVGAFDEGGTCAGAMEVILNDGASYISLPIYGDDATTADPVARHFQHDQGSEDLGKVVPEQGVRQFVELALMLQKVAHVGVEAKKQ